MSTEDRLLPWFKPIKNKIRKFTPLSLILETTNVLHEVKDFPLDKVAMYTPWTLLQIIKWTVLHGEEFTYGLKEATRNDVHEIINKIREMEEESCKVIGDIPSFLRSMAHQQFWFQKQLNVSFYGRQMQVMLKLDRSSAIQKIFKNSTGIDLQTFLELALILSSYFFVRDARTISKVYYASVRKFYSDDDIEGFLSLLSKKPGELREFLRGQDNKIRSFELRMYEQSPLKYAPLMCLGAEHLCYSPAVLQSSLSTFVYDRLKACDPNGFSSEFGYNFERYIKLGLDEAKLVYSTEAEIQQKAGKSIKCVDYVVKLQDSNVFIESKGIELPPYAAVSPNRKVLDNALRDSVVKAIKQGFSTAHYLSESGSRKTNHLLIVTFKNMYIGRGEDFIAGDILTEVAQFCEDNGFSKELIERSNIHFLSSDDFELLMSIVSKGKCLSQFLKDVVNSNNDVSSQKFDFGQHLPSPIEYPQYVLKPYYESGEKIMNLLRV